MTQDLAGRVRTLVDRYWDGSVNDAARALGVPQQTLQRIVSGETLNPRFRALEPIAARFQTTVDWLLTGKGQGPRELDARGQPITGGFIRFDGVLDRLGATGSLRAALEILPTTPFWGASLLFGGTQVSPYMERAVREASEACAEAWADLLEAFAQQFGVERTLTSLAAAQPHISLGFLPFGQALWDSELQPAVARQFEDFAGEPLAGAVRRRSASRRTH